MSGSHLRGTSPNRRSPEPSSQLLRQLQPLQHLPRRHRSLALALRLATSRTPREDVNLARYYMAYLYWSSEQVYEAAVMGDFLPRGQLLGHVPPSIHWNRQHDSR